MYICLFCRAQFLVLSLHINWQQCEGSLHYEVSLAKELFESLSKPLL